MGTANVLRAAFSDTHTSPSYTPRGGVLKRQMSVKRIGDRYRVTVMDSGRYLLFYGESEPVTGDDLPSKPVMNELTQADADNRRVRIVDEKKCIVAGYGGQAMIVPKPQGLGRPSPN
jgi:hypothetical protein